MWWLALVRRSVGSLIYRRHFHANPVSWTQSLDWYCDVRFAVRSGITPHTITSPPVLFWYADGAHTILWARSFGLAHKRFWVRAFLVFIPRAWLPESCW